jgi:hypothetical protein
LERSQLNAGVIPPCDHRHRILTVFPERSPKCIYCLSEDGERSEEHIFPEGLVGKTEYRETGPGQADTSAPFVLNNGEVCKDCNSALGAVDRTLIEELGVLRVMWNGTGTKRGAPSTARRPGLYAVRQDGNVFFALNAEDHAVVTEDGVRVAPAGGSSKAPRITEGTVDGKRTLTVEQPITVGRHFIRAVHKIAFETLCVRRSFTEILRPSHDALREYIRFGRGERRIGLSELTTSGPDSGLPPLPKVQLLRTSGTDIWHAEVYLGLRFLVDLSADNAVLWPSPVIFFDDRKPARLTFRFTVIEGGNGTGRVSAG